MAPTHNITDIMLCPSCADGDTAAYASWPATWTQHLR